MNWTEVILISIALSIDALAIAISLGIKSQEKQIKNCIIVALVFGLFQAIMPLFGYFLARAISGRIEDYDHYVAATLLAFIGIKMLISKPEEINKNVTVINLLILAVASSIDALIIGLSYAFSNTTNINLIVIIIGIVTFIFCLLGGVFGQFIKRIIGNYAERIGGIILIALAIKVLIEHLLFQAYLLLEISLKVIV